MPTPGYLSQSLRRPLPTKDDGILRTVADAQFGAPRRLAAGKRQSHGRCAREGPAKTAAPPRTGRPWAARGAGQRRYQVIWRGVTFALDARQVAMEISTRRASGENHTLESGGNARSVRRSVLIRGYQASDSFH